jgi:hypothetical protein
MSWKRLAFWALLFSGLLVYVLLFERTEQQPVATLPAETYARVFPMEASAITGVIVSDHAKTVRLARTGSGLSVAAPAGARVAPDIIESLVSAIAGAVVIDEIEPGADDSQYGLSPPAFTLQVQPHAGSEPVTLLIGASAPSTVNMYARLPQQNRTILLGTYLRFSLRTFLDNVK